jgi:predicted O-methyltransferase YrrM
VSQILQDEKEIAAFAELIRREGCRSYLEVGAKFGGSLKRVADVMPQGSRFVAVDLPGGTKAWKDSELALKAVIADLRSRGHEAEIIWGNSTAPDVIERVSALGPFDAILIDANHTRPFVERDWANYGPMGKIVAFHDIAWRRAPEWVGTRIDVPQVWDEIKGEYYHEEFKFCPTGKNNGIGVLWR